MSGLDFAASAAVARLRRVIDAQPRACRRDPDLFFPIGTGPFAEARVRRAKNLCATCPVQRECLDVALLTGEEHGIWGGLDAEQRKAMRRSSVAARRQERQRASLAGQVEAWLDTAATPSVRASMRTGLTKFRAWCEEDGLDPAGPAADLGQFARWLSEMRVSARSARVAEQAARSWLGFLRERREVA